MKIVLVGYMGSGKSTVGKLLAAASQLEFIDLDDYISHKLDASIATIFSEKGELFFRKSEHKFLKKLLKSNSDMVLATGGGTPCYSGNMDLMLQQADHVIYLKLSIPELIRRLYKEKEHRPIISHLSAKEMPDFIGKHLFERSHCYSRANHTISCNGKSGETIVAAIRKIVS